jgi:hypothetical protein
MLWREPPDVSGGQEVLHRLVTFLHGKQLRNLHMSASACCPSGSLPHRFLERFLLVFLLAAVAEEMLLRL